MPELEITLASGSPRRAELLELTGWKFSQCSTQAEETQLPGEPARERALRLARVKARAAEAACQEYGLTLAADTLVVDEGEILGKPHDADQADGMLTRLRGQVHTVITAIVLKDHEGRETVEVCETDVPMREYSTEEQVRYIAGGSPFDKAGAYGIQDDDFEPVDLKAMSGCFANVMGLPLCHLVRAMQQMGFEPAADIPESCQLHTGYDCDVYEAILEGEL
jgi:septum formation protein